MWHTLIKHRKWHSLLAYLAGSLSLLTLGIFIALGQAHLTRADETKSNTAPIGEDAHQPNPFPITAAMSDTVQLVLNQYLRDQPMVALTTSDQELTPLTSVVNLYLPISMSAQAQSEPTPTPRPHPTQHADIAVTIWPEPSIHVMRGARLTYELRIRNYDQGKAKGVRVTLPSDQRQMRPVASRLDRDMGDWVSRLTDREVEVTFGPVDGKASRTGLLVFEVATTVANGTILDMRPSYTWWDSNTDEGSYSANWAPVIVGDGSATAPWVATGVTPTVGQAGTVHTFDSNRFMPGEGIVTWLNTPSGVRGLDLRGVVDSQGAIVLKFSSAGLRPGNYQLVLYGARSQLTGVASFTVL